MARVCDGGDGVRRRLLPRFFLKLYSPTHKRRSETRRTGEGKRGVAGPRKACVPRLTPTPWHGVEVHGITLFRGVFFSMCVRYNCYLRTCRGNIVDLVLDRLEAGLGIHQVPAL